MGGGCQIPLYKDWATITIHDPLMNPNGIPKSVQPDGLNLRYLFKLGLLEQTKLTACIRQDLEHWVETAGFNNRVCGKNSVSFLFLEEVRNCDKTLISIIEGFL